MEHDERGPHRHDEPHWQGHAATAYGGTETVPLAATFRAGRAYKVRGLDCAEEVAVLKQAVGPLVGGEDRLAFDVLNGRMTVTNNERNIPDEAIFNAIAATGMSGVAWTPGAKTDDADNRRRQQVLFTAASGIALLIGFILHVLLAGGLAAAWRLLGSHANATMPWPEIAAYFAAALLGARYVVVKAWFAARSLRPDMHLLMTVAVIGAMAIGEWFEAATGLATVVKLGGWYHFGVFDDMRFATGGTLLADPGGSGAAIQHRGNSGVYAVVDQQLWRPAGGGPDSGISVFTRMSLSPSNRNFVNAYIDGGVVVAGLIPNRPNDKFGASVIHTRFSDSIRGFDRDTIAFYWRTWASARPRDQSRA